MEQARLCCNRHPKVRSAQRVCWRGIHLFSNAFHRASYAAAALVGFGLRGTAEAGLQLAQSEIETQIYTGTETETRVQECSQTDMDRQADRDRDMHTMHSQTNRDRQSDTDRQATEIAVRQA